jgi:putative peptide zinc metalloprotease protein
VDKPLFSENWYRVRSLRPKLRSHVKLHRQVHGGDIWYLLEDAASGRYHRFNTAAYHVIAQMDGLRSIEDIWDVANTVLGDDAPVQDEVIQLLGQLHQADVLRTNISPDLEELLQRGSEQREAQTWARFRNPMSVRLRLLDPDRFLNRTLPWLAWLFSPAVLLLWVVTVVVAVLLAGSHWQSLVETVRYEALTPNNLLVLYLVYPCVKLLHELGHGYAAKIEGGEVHEMGVIFMVFIPVPYVDASAANAFASRGRRVLVGAAGVMTELFLAALALFTWVTVSPGYISSICLNIMLIGGISTLFFNGNPLLRFDGYYVLSDLIGIQNLAQRANGFYAYLVQRYAFGVEAARSPARSRYEACWFAGYAPASFVYRLGILVTICLFLLEDFFLVGVVLAVWAIGSQLALPLLKQLDFLLASQRLRARRSRAVGVTVLTVAGFLALVAWFPATSLSRVEGVLYPPDNSHLVSQTDGFVIAVLPEDGSTVESGQTLIQLENNEHQTKMTVARARLKELQARYTAVRSRDLVEAKLVREDIAAVNADIVRLRERIDALSIGSPSSGVFYQLPGSELRGRFVKRGDLLGYVVPPGGARARVVVTQEGLDKIRDSASSVEVRLASRLNETIPGSLLRSVPQGSFLLPSPVLSTLGGGTFVTDPASDQPLATRERVFEFEIQLPDSVEARIGTRVFVRFDHGSEPLLQQWRRDLRQLLLRRLGT